MSARARLGLMMGALAVLGAASAYWVVRGEALLLDLSFIACF